MAGLAAAPRSLERIAALGGLEDGHPLEVTEDGDGRMCVPLYRNLAPLP